ncbi:Uncharacterised protein [Mycobacteroides abscessus subsp. abscessus]|nr:Uncharacterised protein [Mycobacteroides abscessus subsp. abscessus]
MLARPNVARATAPPSRSIGMAIGSLNRPSASPMNGNDAQRNTMLTSLVTPPGATRMRRSTR